MIRPTFNRFADGDPREDFNNRMRHYLVHLEENQRTESYEFIVFRRRSAELRADLLREENRDLRQTLKILRSQIKTIYKEHHGYEKTAVHRMQDAYDRSKS